MSNELLELLRQYIDEKVQEAETASFGDDGNRETNSNGSDAVWLRVLKANNPDAKD